MESIRRYPRLVFRLLQIGVFSLFLARAWNYIIWDSPLRSLLWDEDLLTPWVARMGYTWSEWVTNPGINQSIAGIIQAQGMLFVVAAAAVLFLERFPRPSAILVALGGLQCLLHVCLTTKAHFGQMGQFIEQSLQWGSPFLLLAAYTPAVAPKTLDWLMRWAIALTFCGHGLYAIGFYPVPGNFQEMMMAGLSVSNQQALQFLKLAGILDFLAAGLLLLPFAQWAKWGLYYTIIWGALTAFARIWSYSSLYSLQGLTEQWLPESLSRGVHFLVPLALFYMWKIKKH
jgi:hypothetical protein